MINPITAIIAELESTTGSDTIGMFTIRTTNRTIEEAAQERSCNTTQPPAIESKTPTKQAESTGSTQYSREENNFLQTGSSPNASSENTSCPSTRIKPSPL